MAAAIAVARTRLPRRSLLHTSRDGHRRAPRLHAAATAHRSPVTYPAGPLGRGLQLLAQALTNDLGLRMGYVVFGGCDTHAGQATELDRLLATLAEARAAFQGDLQALGRAHDVAIMTWSEFGRRVGGNASTGTDHGTAAPLLLLGNPVRGGIYGDASDLAHLDQGNLRFTVDFRSVYATVLESWLGAPTPEVLGGVFPVIPALRVTA